MSSAFNGAVHLNRHWNYIDKGGIRFDAREKRNRSFASFNNEPTEHSMKNLIKTLMVVSLVGLIETSASAGSPPSPLHSSPWSDPTRLHPGEYLWVDVGPNGYSRQLVSANGQYHLVLQKDCNLVLYNANWDAVWDSGTVRSPPNTTHCQLTMQSDGNLVIYPHNGNAWLNACWATNTWWATNAHLVVQNDSNLGLYMSADGQEAPGNNVWSIW